MNDLVVLHKKQTVTSSRMVAEVFGKEHKNVLQAIENISTQMSTAEFSALFYKSHYKASNGKTNVEYLMNRDGFSILVMGFTGEKAMQFKLMYIGEFNRMEAEQNKPKLNKIRSVSSVLNDVYRANLTMKKMFPAVPESIALVTAFEQIEGTRGIDLSITKKLIPADTTSAPDFTLKATEVAAKANILYKTGSPNPQEVNKRLAENGLQEKKGKDWRVTEKGMQYGAEFPYSKNGHSGFEIRWSEKVINLVQGIN